jgi:hypothetical protein
MAVIQFGPTVTGIRGTIGGVTFSANRTANYAKQWSRPPYSKSLKQLTTRGSLASNASMWAALDAGDKTDWNTFADTPNELDYDAWGAQRFLSGFQWFARAQQRRSTLSLANPGPVPSGAAATAITGLTIALQTGVGGTSTVTYDDDQFPADSALILYLTFKPGQGAADAWRNWKLILATQDPPNGGVSIHSGWYDAFGDIPANWKAYALGYKQHVEGNRSTGASATALVTA